MFGFGSLRTWPHTLAESAIEWSDFGVRLIVALLLAVSVARADGDMTACLSFAADASGNVSISSSCDIPIAVAWCVDGSADRQVACGPNADHTSFFNRGAFVPPKGTSTHLVFPGTDNTLHYGACKSGGPPNYVKETTSEYACGSFKNAVMNQAKTVKMGGPSHAPERHDGHAAPR